MQQIKEIIARWEDGLLTTPEALTQIINAAAKAFGEGE